MSRQYNAEERARALYYYFGWQGGTVHQLAKETGLTVNQILYSPMVDTRLSTGGFSGVRTCDLSWRINKLAPTQQGNEGYWHDVIRGFWATGPLDKIIH